MPRKTQPSRFNWSRFHITGQGERIDNFSRSHSQADNEHGSERIVLCSPLSQTYCYRVCMYAKALFCPQKNSLKSRGHAAPLEQSEGFERTGSFKASRNHQAPSTSRVSDSDCKLIGKGRVEQNERVLLFTKTMGTLCCSVAAARPVRGTAAEPENAAPSPPYLGALTSLVLTTRCCGNRTASDKATLTKSNMWENGRP